MLILKLWSRGCRTGDSFPSLATFFLSKSQFSKFLRILSNEMPVTFNRPWFSCDLFIPKDRSIDHMMSDTKTNIPTSPLFTRSLIERKFGRFRLKYIATSWPMKPSDGPCWKLWMMRTGVTNIMRKSATARLPIRQLEHDCRHGRLQRCRRNRCKYRNGVNFKNCSGRIWPEDDKWFSSGASPLSLKSFPRKFYDA